MTKDERMEAVAREIFTQIQTSIVMRMRFLDMAVFRLKTIPVEHPLCTDGDNLYYDPVTLLKDYRRESNAVTRDYMHVMMHCIFRHPFVNPLIDQELWDLSCDIAVEALISGLNQPTFSVAKEVERLKVITQLQNEVKTMTAEKLYHYFQDNPPKEEWAALFHADDHEIWYNHIAQASLQGKSTGGSEGTVLTPAGVMSVNLAEEWRDISEHVQMDLESFAKQQGLFAGNMEQMLAELNREKYDYVAFLKKFAVLGEAMKINDDEFDYIFYTYGLKLFKNMPLIEPPEYKEVKRIRDFVIAIDTSGSTSGELVQRFLNKTYNILASTESFFTKMNVFIIQCDAEIQEAVRITKREEFEEYIKTMKILGLGGTDFRPVFSYVDQLRREQTFTNLKGLIYFTDGFGTFPAQKPDYQTAFVYIRDEFNNPEVPLWVIKLVLEKDDI